MTQGSVAFDRAVDYYDQTRGFPPGVEQHATQLFVKAGALTPDSQVLEVAVGTGRIALPLAPHVGSITGLDLSLPMLNKLIEKRKDERVQVVQGDGTHLPFKANAFDAAIAVHFFHLIPTWRDALAELRRVLRPGGVLMHGWTSRDMDERLDRVWQGATGRGRGAERGVPFEQRETFLLESGWTEVGTEHVYLFTVERIPQSYVENLRARLWSHTWSMSDEQLNEGIQALETYIRENIADPTAPMQIQSSFHVRAYQPN
ncbi:MAG: methyltransferase domain-containing protein [Anaerolinea sp.]|nr:methyltransferase domain-containing protein [Anaerolinea sp.]